MFSLGFVMSGNKHIRLTSHAGSTRALALQWGAADPQTRGPIVGGAAHAAERNVIGTYGGSYSVYRALAVAAGNLSQQHRPALTTTDPTSIFGPFPQWADPNRSVSMDPWG
ncbi:MAG: hypothetical protein ACO2Z8_05660, partial [Burkholderiaceae bacterium]